MQTVSKLTLINCGSYIFGNQKGIYLPSEQKHIQRKKWTYLLDLAEVVKQRQTAVPEEQQTLIIPNRI